MASRLVLLLQLLLVSLVSASHFNGAHTSFSYIGKNPDGSVKVEIREKSTFRLCRYGLPWYCAAGNCAQTFNTNVRGPIDNGTNSPAVPNHWCESERVTTRTLRNDEPFLLRASSCCWVRNRNPISSWNLIALVDLGKRSDTGKPNNSPDVGILPFIRVPQNCPRTYKLMSFDPDGDKLRCRYGFHRNLECTGCQQHAGFTLDEGSCTLHYYNSAASTKAFAFEMMVEDFPRQNIIVSYSTGNQAPRSPLNTRPARAARAKRAMYVNPYVVVGTTTAGPTTAGPSTAGPSAAGPSTAGPSTAGPSTAGPSTPGPSTGGRSTPGPSTAGPSTAGPSTAGPSTAGPSTPGPSTGGPSTPGPSTAGPSTAGPSTAGPSTAGPSTAGPSTAGPSTAGPSTAGPSTAGPSTPGPSTAGASTAGPSTPGPSTAGPSTAGPSTAGPSTPGPSTAGASTAGQSTPGPSTAGASTAGPSTWGPSTPGPSTAGASTGGPSTGGPSTPGPSTAPGPGPILPLSQLPLQFSFLVDAPAPSCAEGQYLPQLVYPTPRDGAPIQAEVNKEMEIRVKAQASRSTIHDIHITGPLNIRYRRTTHGEFVIEWTPTQENLGQYYPVCFAVESVSGSPSTSSYTPQTGIYHSEMRCVLVNVVQTKVKSNVICSESSMTVEIERSSFSRLSEDHLQLNDPTNTVCSLQRHSNSTHVIAVIPLNACGTQIEEDDTNLIFRNEVSTADNSSYVITRKHLLAVQVCCVYPKRGNVTQSFTVHRDNVTVWEKGFGKFTYGFEFFTDSRYGNMFDPNSYPLEYDVGSDIFMQIEATSSINNTQLFVESCRASPYDNPNSRPQYSIIDNGCKVDSTVEIYSPAHNKQFRFSMEAFKFIGMHDQVYISCSVMMCEAGASGTRCSQGCLNSTVAPSRRKREAVSQSSMHLVSQGPLRLARSAESTERSGMNLNLNLVFIAGCLLAAVGMISAVVMYKAKVSKVKYQPLPTSEN